MNDFFASHYDHRPSHPAPSSYRASNTKEYDNDEEAAVHTAPICHPNPLTLLLSRPVFPHTDVNTLATSFKANNFIPILSTYFRRLIPPPALPVFPNIVDRFDVYKRTPLVPAKGRSKSLPAHFDTVFARMADAKENQHTKGTCLEGHDQSSFTVTLPSYYLQFYEPLVVGKFFEPRDPYLAYIAYAKRSHELVVITNDNSMFKQQARYFVKHCEPDLWTQVLAHDIVHCRRPLIDQIVATALRKCTDPDDVSITVKAFLQADLPILQEAWATCHGHQCFRVERLVSIHCLKPGVSRLAKSQLDGLRLKDSVESYVKAQGPSNFAEVIEIPNHTGQTR
ncbi:hypothetical protein GALMADRAFT_148604 [Galerina marginata CBS 339.88]|uniref:Uncharacterized protein n=1 Tax=Galerina marginata (strain CBS 339.88) TaxID=685588 RepID=A0A067S6L0_GALM3|nr:hypothetical protein GALMADRAFT_148604 [Galerina marginata CBS 339.88]